MANQTAQPAISVMVVEDETLIRMMLIDLFAEHGLVILEAENADKAVSLSESEAPRIHVLFTDVRMPGSMDGLALAHHAKRHWPWIAVLVTSGHARLSNDNLPEGARFIPKPYDPSTVLKHVEELGTKAPRPHGSPT